ncbi:MAG: outer membrane lipoprotein carrier protein LolA [Gemmatimonadota bacterium]|nr:outer membrane lipoprotein carrier protein LolA [Gemmatimonadota bacterium]MDE3216360.1 outer membrane lipoprotein carrier protein LolA [Gemmatimonadota bacterium]
MNRLVLLAAAALAAAHAPPPAQQSPASAAVAHAVEAWKGVRTVRASFEQTVTNALTGTSARASGDYEQRRPDRLAVRFTDPDGDRIVADGRWLWLYLPSSTPGQVVRRADGADGSATVDLTAQFLDDPFDRYTISGGAAATLDGRPVRVVTLVPRPGGPAAFSNATVWIDDGDGYIRQFEVVQANGVTRRIHLTTLRVNVPLDDADFRFTVPKGVRVVDDRG